MGDCVFCKIMSGEFSSMKVYEDEHTLAFMDIAKDVDGYEGVNLLHASGESADQSVPHFHMHIIPRKAKDGIEAWPNFSGAKYPVEDTFKTLTENMTK